MKKLLLLTLVAFSLAVPAAAWAGDAANSLTVCSCGMVFTPDANTKYVEFEGHKYACCTDGCHAMASKDPAVTARSSQAAVARMVSLSQMKMGVANVFSVTEVGTHAMCACGKKFNIDATTEYLKVEGESYACCSHACHEIASKDPAASAAAAKSYMKKG